MKNMFLRSISFILLLFITTTCDDVIIDCDTYDFSDCTIEEPYEALLYINLTMETEYDSVRVAIFIGNVDDKDTIDFFIADYDLYEIWLDVDKEYSASAEYYIDNQLITVIDGDKLRTSRTSRCEESCYIIKGDELNLELKFNNL